MRNEFLVEQQKSCFNVTIFSKFQKQMFRQHTEIALAHDLQIKMDISENFMKPY